MTKDLFYEKKGDDFILYKKGILQAHNTLSPLLKLQPPWNLTNVDGFVSKLRKKKTKKKKKATCCKDWILRLFKFDLWFLLLTLFCFVLTSIWLNLWNFEWWELKVSDYISFQFSVPPPRDNDMYVSSIMFSLLLLFLGSRYNYNILKKKKNVVVIGIIGIY